MTIDIRQIFPVNDDTLWADIPNFPGYQLSNKGHVRSYKQLKKYPYGILKTPDKKGCFTLTDKNNNVVKIHVLELKTLVESNCMQFYSTYSKESLCRGRGRNQRCFVDYSNKNALHGNIIKSPKPIRKEECGIFKFTIIPDKPEIIKPIRFIEKPKESNSTWLKI